VSLDGKEIRYHFEENILFRNQFPMNREEVRITEFDIQPLEFNTLNDFGGSKPATNLHEVVLRSIEYNSGVRLICMLESDGRTVDLSCDLRPRNDHLNEYEFD
jgi:hypothetical protein